MVDDRKFKDISNLKWLPWVGEHFNSLDINNRLLIVGESHYHDNTPASIEKHNSPDFTRQVVEELAVERWYYGKFSLIFTEHCLEMMSLTVLLFGIWFRSTTLSKDQWTQIKDVQVMMTSTIVGFLF
jgi:hypothetical protein